MVDPDSDPEDLTLWHGEAPSSYPDGHWYVDGDGCIEAELADRMQRWDPKRMSGNQHDCLFLWRRLEQARYTIHELNELASDLRIEHDNALLNWEILAREVVAWRRVTIEVQEVLGKAVPARYWAQEIEEIKGLLTEFREQRNYLRNQLPRSPERHVVVEYDWLADGWVHLFEPRAIGDRSPARSIGCVKIVGFGEGNESEQIRLVA